MSPASALGARGRAKMRKSERMRLSRRASFFMTPSVWARSSPVRVSSTPRRVVALTMAAKGLRISWGTLAASATAAESPPRGAEPLGAGEPRLQRFALRHVGDQLEEKDLAVGLAYGGAAERE